MGYTSKDVKIRLNEHNTGSNKFTSQNGPFIILYSETFPNKTSAIKRERFLKSGQGRKFLDELQKYARLAQLVERPLDVG